MEVRAALIYIVQELPEVVEVEQQLLVLNQQII
jgi:hypothetical protein